MKMDCKIAQAALPDYLGDELTGPERNAIQKHIDGCSACWKEFSALQAVMKKTESLQVPDPGSEFWSTFPDKVLKRFQAEQTRSARPGIGIRLAQRFADWWSAASWPQLAAQAALVLIIVGGLAVLIPQYGTITFNSAEFQARMADDHDLALLARANAYSMPADSNFAFAEDAGAINYFVIGSLYAESLAFIYGDDNKAADKRLSAIERILADTAPPVIVDQLRAVRRPPDTASKAESLERLAALGSMLDEHAETLGGRQQVLLRAGSWLVDVGLAASAGDPSLLGQARQLEYLRNELQRFGAPAGALRAFEEMAKILGKPELTEGDRATLRQQLQQIQAIMS